MSQHTAEHGSKSRSPIRPEKPIEQIIADQGTATVDDVDALAALFHDVTAEEGDAFFETIMRERVARRARAEQTGG